MKSRRSFFSRGILVPILMLVLPSFFSPERASAEVGKWLIQLDLMGPELEQSDIENLAGILPQSTDGYDNGYDICPGFLPGTTEYPDPHLYFPHPEFEGLGEEISGRCDFDIRAPFQTVGEWEFVVETSIPNQEFSLTWDLFIFGNEVPTEYRVAIESATGEELADLWTDSVYRLTTGDSPFSATFHLVIINDPPGIVTSATATVQGNSILLRWNPPDTPDLAGTIIRYGTEGGIYPSWTVIEPGTQEASFSDLIFGSTYYFQIVVVDRTGLEGSPAFLEVYLTPPVFLGDADSDGWIDYGDLWALSTQWYVPDATGNLDPLDGFQEEDLLIFHSRWHTSP